MGGLVLGARDDQEVLAVAAYPGGQVVELEERLEAVGVLLPLLLGLDDGELALDQAQRAQREADEAAVDPGPQPLQPGGDRVPLGAQPVPLIAIRCRSPTSRVRSVSSSATRS